jgi:hypothetical protein
LSEQAGSEQEGGRSHVGDAVETAGCCLLELFGAFGVLAALLAIPTGLLSLKG